MNESNDSPFHEIIIDHARFIIDGTYREQMRREVAAVERGALTMVDVEHEADFYCCALEPWAVTLPRLLSERDGA